MIYLISQDWSNTSNNHAGIKYLCNKLEEIYPSEYKSLVIPALWEDRNASKFKIIRYVQLILARMKHRRFTFMMRDQLISKLKKGDKVFLMEYMEKMFPMKNFAISLKKANPSLPLYAMVHLVPQRLEKSFLSAEFLSWSNSVDKILTLGHSLTDYFISRGVEKSKMVTTFHYVDQYYYNDKPIRQHKIKSVIAMGNQMRNVNLLKEVVVRNPNVQFTICQGVNDLSSYFLDCQNVNLIPFVAEADLRKHMQDADISINAMEDTIGSNVIVTSLAMGLAMVCSDVGSIRDYCNESNTIFCKTSEDFTRAIEMLQSDDTMLSNMQLQAYKRGLELSINKFAKELSVL